MINDSVSKSILKYLYLRIDFKIGSLNIIGNRIRHWIFRNIEITNDGGTESIQNIRCLFNQGYFFIRWSFKLSFTL